MLSDGSRMRIQCKTYVSARYQQFKIKRAGYIHTRRWNFTACSVNAITCDPCDPDTALATLQTKTEKTTQSSSEHYTKKEDKLAYSTTRTTVPFLDTRISVVPVRECGTVTFMLGRILGFPTNVLPVRTSNHNSIVSLHCPGSAALFVQHLVMHP